MKMRNIRTDHIQHLINSASDSGKGLATLKKIQNLASLLCKFAMANDIIDKNYAQLIIMPKSEKKADKVSFTREQLDTMWNLQKSDDGIGSILLLCYTGLRINEFLDIKKEYVDIDLGIIKAPGSKTESGKNRIIALPRVIIPIVEQFLQKAGEYLYSTASGKRWNSSNYRNRVFNPTLNKYNLNMSGKITPHSCRHTYAWLCVTNGVNQKATMDLLGHSKYSISAEIYADATKKDIDFLCSEANKIK